MHISGLVLSLTAFGLTFAAATPLKEVTPPKYFLLKLEANDKTRNKTYNGYHVAPFGVSATQSVAYLIPPTGLGSYEFHSLTNPTVSNGTTFYSLVLNAPEGTGTTLFVQPVVQWEAFWEPLIYDSTTATTPTPQETQFYVNGTSPSSLYLQME